VDGEPLRYPGGILALVRTLVALSTLVAIAACSGDVTDGEACLLAPDNSPPDAPSLLAPAANAVGVPSELLTLVGTAFADPDPDDVHSESEFEIWSFRDGAPLALVWTAAVADPAKLTSVTLADGEFAAGPSVTALGDWIEYGARARYRDSNAVCPSWSAWSDYVPFRSDDGSYYLFDPSRIHDIYIDLSPDSWNAINAEALPPDCVPYLRPYHPGTVRFEDQVFEGAGVRVKGGCGSARDLNGKAGFKLNLEWDDPDVAGCPPERHLYGEQRLTLNNLVQDRSFVHERLAYALHHAMGVPTPRTAHIRVHVNGELWGLYLNVETIDRRFLRRWFDSNQGMLYEGTYWCDLIQENVPPTLDDTYCLSRKFKGGPCTTPEPDTDPADYTLLRELVAKIDALPPGGFYPEVEAFFDFDTLLSSWAVHAIVAHWDGYEFEIVNNYRVYHDPSTDRWTIIPTGLDQTFDQDMGIWEAQGRLAVRCLEEPECEAAYAARVHQALDAFTQLDLSSRALEIRDQISNDVAQDPRKEVGYDQFLSRVEETRQWIARRPNDILQMLAQRGY